MVTRKIIDEFFSKKKFALIRPSSEGPKIGEHIDQELIKRGYTVYIVSQKGDTDNVNNCWSKLEDLPEPVDGVIITVPSVQTEEIVRQVEKLKIPLVWIQPGSESKDAIQICENNRIGVIYGQCIMMFADPVVSVHRFHRWLKKIFGGLPK